jgi:hypothetical protein
MRLSEDVTSTTLDVSLVRDVSFADAELQRLLEGVLGGAVLHSAPAAPQRADYPGETPTEGTGAVARWVALHDRARALRLHMKTNDIVAAHHVQRAVRSLFLYEHQLTAKTRRRARTALWQRDQRSPLPAFAERARWATCRCARCQPTLWIVSTAWQSRLLRTA